LRRGLLASDRRLDLDWPSWTINPSLPVDGLKVIHGIELLAFSSRLAEGDVEDGRADSEMRAERHP